MAFLKKFKLVLIVGIAASLSLLWGCSEEEHFRIEGKLWEPTMKIVELTYLDNGAFKRISTHSDESGKWTMDGVSAQPTLAFLTVSGSEPLATLVVQNGDHLTVELEGPDGSKGVKVKGNRTSELIAQFDAESREALAKGNGGDMNKRVADFIVNNPKEMASAVLLILRFDSRGNEVLADSLMGLISPKAKPTGVMQNFAATIANQVSAESRENIQAMSLYDRRDTTVRYNPARQSYTLIAFIDTNRKMRDSIVPKLRNLREKWPENRLMEIEVSLARDSAAWKQSVSGDSAKWVQAWAPGTVSSSNFRKLSVRRAPFFIVADSAGHQLYRGSSIRMAEKELSDRLTVSIPDTLKRTQE